ncbi:MULTISPECIES: M28 family peptidase [unclassified Brevundimonas]|uniref:M28 family peptidase n=1 Tax=unclassified Brevundimonas TaxID=2622653 RepID=UPI0025BD3079|nr:MULTISPECIES: M28 family peptidase [unclassified Brevundimonas]
MRALPTRLAVAAVLALAACETKPLAVEQPAVAVASHDYTQLMADLKTLSADDMQGRDTGSEGGAKARQYIVDRLEALGVGPSSMGRLQPWSAQGRSPDGPKTFNGTNIIGLIPGTRVSDKYIVVTAHYDHVGVHDGQIYNGADDNASGVATMLELAKRLKETPPEHSVLIVALDGEERGLLGAKEFVEAPPVPLSSISLNINFDMTARADVDGYLWVTGTYQHPYLRPLLEPIPANGSIRLAFGKDRPEDEGADNWVYASDHGAFHRAGLPFLYFGVNFHEDYHKPSDDVERINPAVFQSSTELAIESFRRIDAWLDR